MKEVVDLEAMTIIPMEYKEEELEKVENIIYLFTFKNYFFK